MTIGHTIKLKSGKEKFAGIRSGAQVSPLKDSGSQVVLDSSGLHCHQETMIDSRESMTKKQLY